MFDQLWASMEESTDPSLLAGLKLHTRRWIQNPGYEAPSTGNTALNRAVRSQNKIGWTNFFRGYISNKFLSQQRNYLIQQDKRNALPLASDWGTQLIQTLWQIADNIWTLRCQQLHGEDAFADPEEKRKAMSWLKALYNCQNEVRPQDKFLFARPFKEWQLTSAKTIINWCRQVKISLRKWKIVDANALLAAHRPIYEYFLTSDSPDAGTNAGLSPGIEESANQTQT